MPVGEQMVPSETHASETNNHPTLAYSMAMGQNPDARVVI